MSSSIQPSDPWGGSCTGCGAFLAADQRYCLACGTRRDGARLPFRDALASGPSQSVAPATVHAPAPAGVPAYGPAGASPTLLTTLAALACVLLAFGVGVLVGDDGGTAQQVAAPAAAQAVVPAATTTTSATSASADDAKAKKATADAKTSAADEESATPSKPKAAPKKLVESSAKAIKGLENAKTPQEYSEQSSKLPDVVVTGGGK